MLPASLTLELLLLRSLGSARIIERSSRLARHQCSTAAGSEQLASSSAEAALQEAAQSGSEASWLFRAVKQKDNKTFVEVLEEKRKSFFAKLTFWEKVYYAAGALGGGYFLYTRLDLDGSKAAAAAAEQKKKEETEAKRLEALPAFLRGRSFAAEDDESVTAFEGASPAEIQALALKLRRTHGLSSVSSPSSFSPGVAGMGMAFRGGEGGSREDQPGIGQLMQGGRWALPGLEEEDPYEGMSPEEIDELLAKQQAAKAG